MKLIKKKGLPGNGSLPPGEFPSPTSAYSYPPYAAQMPATPFEAPVGSWTLAILPDTQNYCSFFPEVYSRQCEWIVAHRRQHNILFVAHEGDIVSENIAAEWQNARRAMSTLNEARMPYCLLPGNHDLGQPDHCGENRWTMLNDYFKEADYSASPAFHLYEPGKMENSWHAFDTPTGKHLIIALEYGPRDGAVEFARASGLQHPDHKIILVTHAYLYCDSTRYGEPKPGVEQKWAPKPNPGLIADGGVNDGHDMWMKFVSQLPNIQFTLSGHVLDNGTGYLASRADDGHLVHQILANYQAAVQVDDGAEGVSYADVLKGVSPYRRHYGGGGFLRLIQFHPDCKTVAIKTYSPWYDHWLTQPDQQFVVSLA